MYLKIQEPGLPTWERAGHSHRGVTGWLILSLKFVSQSPDTNDPNTGGVAGEAAVTGAGAVLRRLSSAVYIYWPCNPGFNPHRSSALP